MVEFESVEKDYGDLKALRGVSFSIPQGGIVGLLGPNGAGKTTSLRIMTGYLEPTAGAVRIAGEVFTPNSVELKRRIGYLPESAPGYGDMLAWDYLMYEARLHGLDGEVRVPEVIREVGLGSHAHKPIRELSKGYRQRVGLAHTLLHDPELLVLDEPTNGLDPNQILEVRALIRRIAETKTVILSTHIMQEVEALCRRVVVIHKGTIRYDGAIDSFTPSVQKIHLLAGDTSNGELTKMLQELPGVRSVAPEEHVPPEEQGMAEEHGVPAECVPSDERRTAAALVPVVVTGDTDEDLRPRIFKLAAESGRFSIYEMTRERTSMEDIFHELTTEEDAHDEQQ